MKTVLILLAVFLSALVRAQYQAIYLHTPLTNNRGYAWAAGDGQRVGSTFSSGASGYALLWTGTSPDYTILTPPGYSYSRSIGVGNGFQVGQGGLAGRKKALLWHGDAASAVTLDVPAFLGTTAHSVWGSFQVGEGDIPGPGGSIYAHALLWSGTPESAIDLHPSGYIISDAVGVYQNTQAGYGFASGGGGQQGLLWHGTAASAIRLTPAIAQQSNVRGVWHDKQLGWMYSPSFERHAIMWNGSATDYVDLNPNGYLSDAFAANSQFQVGEASIVNEGHAYAVRWSGSAASMLNLHQYLDSTYTDSYATGIDEDGTIVGYADSPTIGTVPVMWLAVPEPSSLIVISAFLALATGLRNRRGKS